MSCNDNYDQPRPCYKKGQSGGDYSWTKKKTTTCPTCSCPCRVVSDKEGTSYYEPESPQVGQLIKTLMAQQEDELRTILSARPGETVVEAAKRWRKMVEFYMNINNYYSTSGKTSRIAEDCGQRARECIGGEK